MVHVGGISPSLGGALPKSPSFHQGLALATVLPQESSKAYAVTFALHYQPLQPLLIGKIVRLSFRLISLATVEFDPPFGGLIPEASYVHKDHKDEGSLALAK